MPSFRQLFLEHIGQTSPSPLLFEVVKAEGSFLYGPDGEDYLDLISGVCVSNTGHGNPRVIKAVKDQVDSYMHVMVYGEVIQSPQVRYASLLASLLPPQLQSVFFVNSGSEAVEGGIKLARRYTGKSEIIYFRNAYHGSTTGALSVQGSDIYRNAFRPLMPGTVMAEFNDMNSLSLITDKTAAVIVEPVQAEAGIIEPVDTFLPQLRERCTLHHSMLIFDEIQTGFGRLGSLFALQKYNVTPDILLLAKALGGGMPLGAFISSNEIMSSLSTNPILGHITTFGGHPVCCAAGLASLEFLVENNLPADSDRKGNKFKELLKNHLITEIRGPGLLLAVVINRKELLQNIYLKAPKHGLLLDSFLFCDNAFRISPSLTITDEEIVIACQRIDSLLNSVADIN
jgi:acetylornithine/succinyldiaminopimelate/putrescine aminotransferase